MRISAFLLVSDAYCLFEECFHLKWSRYLFGIVRVFHHVFKRV